MADGCLGVAGVNTGKALRTVLHVSAQYWLRSHFCVRDTNYIQKVKLDGYFNRQV